MSVKKIDTAAIESAAATIAGINQELADTLESSKSTVQSMSSVWTGQAAEAAIAAFSAFEQKYVSEYSQMLDQYTKFLSNIAATGYQEAEQQGINVADMI